MKPKFHVRFWIRDVKNIYFESLGLDMTSVILNRFIKKGQQQTPFFVYDLFSFYTKNHQNAWFTHDRLLIQRILQFSENFLFHCKIAWKDFFFQYKKTYEVVPTYWFALTLDPYSYERNKNFLFSSSSILYSFLYSKKV